jgi:quercetin dioxygenase-like cupin family protein
MEKLIENEKKCLYCKQIITSSNLKKTCSKECAFMLQKKTSKKELNQKKNNSNLNKEKKVKCLGCSKMIEVSGLKNVCNLKCAEKYSKNYNYQSNMEHLDKEQRKNWEQSPYYPLVKEYEEKVIADYKKNKIPNKMKKKPDYTVFKKLSLSDLEEKIIDEMIKEKIIEEIIEEHEQKNDSISEYCSVSQCCKIPKGWGHELIIHNCPEYCGKILVFREGCKFSMHYHILKQETWYVNKGTFTFTYIDTEKAITHKRTLKLGDVVTIKRGMPHQLLALEDGEIFEISTEHFDSDSYRIAKGD